MSGKYRQESSTIHMFKRLRFTRIFSKAKIRQQLYLVYAAVVVIHVSDDYLRMRLDSGDYLSEISVDQGPVCYSSDRMKYGMRQPDVIDYEQPYFQRKGRIRQEGVECFVNISALHTYQSDSRLYICTLDFDGYQNIRNILYLCGAVLLLALTIPLIMIHFFTAYFVERVGVLRQEMHKASRQDYELIPIFQGNDELSEAFADLQIMVKNIKEQEAKVYQAQIKEQALLINQQEMEFKMLASQINPHFLYNTLETIRMKAFTAGDREVATAVKLLGKSMRYVLENVGAADTTLEKELDHVDVYMMIQHLRFGDRIRYERKVEEGLILSAYRILPLLLQPVVENAIVHGMEEKEEGGLITLSVYTRAGVWRHLHKTGGHRRGCRRAFRRSGTWIPWGCLPAAADPHSVTGNQTVWKGRGRLSTERYPCRRHSGAQK